MAGFRDLTRAQRSREPYLHIEPCFLNVVKCMKIFGQYFKEFYLSRTIKENTDLAPIFNNHLLATFTMDACIEREAKTLAEALCDPVPGQLFCSTEQLAGSEDSIAADYGRNQVILPYPFAKDVFISFFHANFLSRMEREDWTRQGRFSLICQINIVREDFIQADPLVIGALSFDHFRNDAADIELTPHAEAWFETLAFDIDEFAAAGDQDEPVALGALDKTTLGERLAERFGQIAGRVPPPAGVEALGDLIFAEMHLCGAPVTAAILMMPGDGPGDVKEPLTAALLTAGNNAAARLAATPAHLLIVQHCGPIDESVRETMRAFTVAPHAPRRFCLIDGADTLRIIQAGLIIQAGSEGG